MFLLATLVAILFFGIAWFGISIGLDRLVLWLATGDKWYSPFRLRPPPGEIRFLLKGSDTGPIDRFIHDVRGWEVNAVGIFEEVPVGTTKTKNGYLEEKLGVVIVPLNRYYHSRDMKYDVRERVKGVETMVGKDRKGPQFFFNTVMSIDIEEAEDAGGIPINVQVTFTLRLIDPIKAEFTVGKPEDQASSAVKAIVRLYVGKQKFNDLRNTTRELPTEDLIAQCGFEIVGLRLESFTLANEADDYVKATRQQEVNTLNAEAAKKKAEEIGTLAQAEANKIRLRNEARSATPNGHIYAVADAIVQTGLSTLVIGDAMMAITPTPPSGGASGDTPPRPTPRTTPPVVPSTPPPTATP